MDVRIAISGTLDLEPDDVERYRQKEPAAVARALFDQGKDIKAEVYTPTKKQEAGKQRQLDGSR